MLNWSEFEGIAGIILEKNNFFVKQNFRFTNLGRKNEIDILGLKKPIVLSIDCKHWHKELPPSSLRNIVSNQIKRTKSLMKLLPTIAINLECDLWLSALFIPAVITLVSPRQKFSDSVPIIPILKLQDFLNQLLGNLDQLLIFKKKFNPLL